MKAIPFKSAVSAAILCLSQSAFAGVIDFQDLDGSLELAGVGTTYTTQSFTFSYEPAAEEPFPTGLFAVGPRWQFNTNGSIALAANSDNAVTTLMRNDGRPFALLAIDLAELNGGGPATVVFQGTKASGRW